MGRGGISIGTTSVLVDEVAEFRVDLDHQIFSMPSPYRDCYVVCAENGLGGKMLEHVLRNVVYAADELGDHRPDAFAALDHALRASDPGAGGVMFLPWLGGVERPAGRQRDARRLREHVARDHPPGPASVPSSRVSPTTSAG